MNRSAKLLSKVDGATCRSSLWWRVMKDFIGHVLYKLLDCSQKMGSLCANGSPFPAPAVMQKLVFRPIPTLI